MEKQNKVLMLDKCELLESSEYFDIDIDISVLYIAHYDYPSLLTYLPNWTRSSDFGFFQHFFQIYLLFAS